MSNFKGKNVKIRIIFSPTIKVQSVQCQQRMRVKKLQCWSVLVPFAFKGTCQLSFPPFDGVVFYLALMAREKSATKPQTKMCRCGVNGARCCPFPSSFVSSYLVAALFNGATVADKEMLQLPCKSFKRPRRDYGWRGKPGCSEILRRSGIRKWGLSFTKETQRLVKGNIEPVQRAISPKLWAWAASLHTVPLKRYSCLRARTDITAIYFSISAKAT